MVQQEIWVSINKYELCCCSNQHGFFSSNIQWVSDVAAKKKKKKHEFHVLRQQTWVSVVVGKNMGLKCCCNKYGF